MTRIIPILRVNYYSTKKLHFYSCKKWLRKKRSVWKKCKWGKWRVFMGSSKKWVIIFLEGSKGSKWTIKVVLTHVIPWNFQHSDGAEKFTVNVLPKISSFLFSGKFMWKMFGDVQKWDSNKYFVTFFEKKIFYWIFKK